MVPVDDVFKEDWRSSECCDNPSYLNIGTDEDAVCEVAYVNFDDAAPEKVYCIECVGCGAPDNLPYNPEGRPMFCRECYAKHGKLPDPDKIYSDVKLNECKSKVESLKKQMASAESRGAKAIIPSLKRKLRTLEGRIAEYEKRGESDPNMDGDETEIKNL